MAISTEESDHEASQNDPQHLHSTTRGLGAEIGPPDLSESEFTRKKGLPKVSNEDKKACEAHQPDMVP